MTILPEAKLASEVEFTDATVVRDTNYDVWLARDFLPECEECPDGSERALQSAIVTAPATEAA